MPQKSKFMRGKKKKGRIVKDGHETTNKVAEGLINKLNAAGASIDVNALKSSADDSVNNSMLDQSAWTYYSESTNVDTQLDQSNIVAAADINLKADLEDMDKLEEKKQNDDSSKGKTRDKTVDVGDVQVS